MKLIERVYYSILCKPVKNLLLFLVITLLGAFLSASFSIFQANRNLEKEVREKLNPIVLIEWQGYDYDKEISYYDKEDEKSELINEYRNDKRIKIMENRYTLYNPYLSFRMKDQNGKIYTDFGGSVNFNLNNDYDSPENFAFLESLVNLNFVGIDYSSIADISNGTASLIRGRVFSQEEIENSDYKMFWELRCNTNSIVTSFYEKLSSFQLTIPIADIMIFDESNISYQIKDLNIDLGEIEIIGVGKQEGNNNAFLKYHSKYTNTGSGHYISSILMDKIGEELVKIYELLAEEYPWIKEEVDYIYYGKKFVEETYIELNDADELESFIKEIKSNGGDLIKEVYSFSDSYNDVQTVTKTLNLIAMISLVVCSIASIILISLVLHVFIQERKYEIGVYLSMGESRKRVITQILLEVLLVGMLGISVSVFTGHMIGKALSSDLLEKQVAQHIEINDGMIDKNEYEISQEEVFDTYEVSITGEYIISVYVGGVVVLLLSSVYPMRTIMKMNAKEMLQ